jgi:hypothetical protein
MIPKAAEVRLTPEDRAVLEARVRAPTTEQRDVFRARIVLLASDGCSTREIARVLNTMPRTVSLWRGRFSRDDILRQKRLGRLSTMSAYERMGRAQHTLGNEVFSPAMEHLFAELVQNSQSN